MNPPIPKLAVMLVAEGIFDRVLSYGECVRFLKRLDFGAVASYVAVLSQFNEAAFESVPLMDAGQVRHVTNLLEFILLGDELSRAREQMVGLPGQFVPFSTQALMATIELAGRFSPRAGQSTGLNGAERLRVSHVLLSFQSEALSRRLLEDFRTKKISDWAQLPKDAVEQFIRNMVAHNPNRPYANSLARLFAYATKQSIGELFAARKSRTLPEWFGDNLGMSAEQYLVAAFLSGTPSLQFQIERPSSSDLVFELGRFYGSVPADVRERVGALLQVATIDGTVPWELSRQSNTLADLLYESNQMHATPVIAFGDRRLIVSTTLLRNLYACGLPHSSLNSLRMRQAEALTIQQVKSIRGEFGMMFEGYVQWLFHEWYGDRQVQLYFAYEIYWEGNWRERDIVIISDGIAFVIEIKGHVVDFDLRRTGSFSALKRFIAEPVLQAYTAAEALLAGNARAADGSPIPAVGRVVPVALVYDPIPLSIYTGDHFEPWLERMLSLPVFTSKGGRSGALMLSLDDLELAELALRMDVEPKRLLAALLIRTRSPELRYEKIDTLGGDTGGQSRPAPVKLLVRDANEFLRSVAISFQQPTAAGA
jgi:hypothetical protein